MFHLGALAQASLFRLEIHETCTSYRCFPSPKKKNKSSQWSLTVLYSTGYVFVSVPITNTIRSVKNRGDFTVVLVPASIL